MRVILDECLPRKLAFLIQGFEVITVPQRGWAGYTNGKLLALVEKEFDAFVTIDRNLVAQQKLESTKILVIVLKSTTNRLQNLRILVPRIIDILKTKKTGIFIVE